MGGGALTARATPTIECGGKTHLQMRMLAADHKWSTSLCQNCNRLRWVTVTGGLIGRRGEAIHGLPHTNDFGVMYSIVLCII